MKAEGDRRVYAINLNLAEGQLVFEALAERPFKQVYELIGRLNHRANEVAEQGGDVTLPQAYPLDAAELDLVTRALSELPYGRVHRLLASLNEQVQADTLSPETDGATHG